MGLLRFAEKWGPEFTMVLAGTVIAYDEFMLTADDQWEMGDLVLCYLVAAGVTYYGAQADHLDKLPIGGR